MKMKRHSSCSQAAPFLRVSEMGAKYARKESEWKYVLTCPQITALQMDGPSFSASLSKNGNNDISEGEYVY